MKTLQKTLLAIVIASNTYTSASPYTVIINPDKDSIVFVTKSNDEVTPPTDGEEQENKVEIISFEANTNTPSKGDILTFNWTVKNAVTLKFNGQIIDNRLITHSINLSSSGTFNYVLEAIDSYGNSEQKTITVEVADINMIKSFTVDRPLISNVNTALIFTWDMPTPTKLTLSNNLGYSTTISNSLKTTTYGRIHPVGDTIYTLEATNEDGQVFKKTATVKTIAMPVITSFDFPSIVYAGQSVAFTFDATNGYKYQMRSASGNTGFPTTFIDVTSGVQKTVCGGCVGTFNIVLAAYNEAGGSASITKPLTIEASPTATIAMINNVRYQNTVAPNTALTFDVFSKSAGSTLVRKATNSATAAVVAFPTNAPAEVGNYPYYLSACKTVNNEERCSVPLTATVIVK